MSGDAHPTADPHDNPPPPYSHHDSQKLLQTQHNNPPQDAALMEKLYAPITPHRLRSQLLVNNLKASGILPYNQCTDEKHHHRPAPLKHSAKRLEAIGFDENASMYSSYKGEGEVGMWKDGGGEREREKEKKRASGEGRGGTKRLLKKLVGKGEEKGEEKGEKL